MSTSNLAAVAMLGATLVMTSCADKLGNDCVSERTCAPGGSNGAGGTTTGGSGGTAGHAGTTGGAGGTSGGGGGAACNGKCAVPTPACDKTTNTCVGCVGNGDCSAPTPACDTTKHGCVECLGDGDCTGTKSKCDTATQKCAECLSSGDCKDPTKSRCAAGVCSPCSGNGDCSHLTGTTVCETTSNKCVQCTQSDAAACGSNPCNPVTNKCSAFGTNRKTCESCDTDADCAVANDYCIPMLYKGVARADGYCALNDSGGCAEPYSVDLAGRTTLSGVTGIAFCGINETLTTCEAVRALQDNQTCPSGNDTECPTGGLCRKVGSLANHCTYPCGGASECLNPPTAGNTCGGGTPATTPSYCGG